MSSNEHRPHILIVNDTREILDLLRDLLEDEGHRVTTSMALLDLDRIKTLVPDVIMQDLRFDQNQEEGWHFLTLVRTDPELAFVPLILCTAAVRTVKDPDIAARLDQLGVRVVLKPFHIDALLAVLAEASVAPRTAEPPRP